MRIVVTGGAGFLGSRTVHFLAEAGHEIVCVDATASRHPKAEWRVADLRRRESPYDCLRGADAVIHLANHSNATKADAQTVLTENTAMNVNVFQAAAELGVRRVVFSSSIQAMSGGPVSPGNDYPRPGRREIPPLPLAGDAPPRAGNAYGQSKIFGEQLLAYHVRKSAGGLEGVSVRFPFISRDPARMRRWFTADSEFASSEYYTWIWIDDAARLLQACVETEPLPGYRTYFPVGLLPPGWPDAETLARTTLSEAPRRNPDGTLETIVDISEITRDLGWRPTPWSAFELEAPEPAARSTLRTNIRI